MFKIVGWGGGRVEAMGDVTATTALQVNTLLFTGRNYSINMRGKQNATKVNK